MGVDVVQIHTGKGRVLEFNVTVTIQHVLTLLLVILAVGDHLVLGTGRSLHRRDGPTGNTGILIAGDRIVGLQGVGPTEAIVHTFRARVHILEAVAAIDVDAGCITGEVRLELDVPLRLTGLVGVGFSIAAGANIHGGGHVLRPQQQKRGRRNVVGTDGAGTRGNKRVELVVTFVAQRGGGTQRVVSPRIVAVVLVGVQLHRLTELAKITAAFDAIGGLAGFAQRGKQDRDQQSDDPDDDEQFNERKALGLRTILTLHDEAPFDASLKKPVRANLFGSCRCRINMI